MMVLIVFGVTCALLALRSFIVRRRNFGTVNICIIKNDGDSGFSEPDTMNEEWPSQINLSEKPLTQATQLPDDNASNSSKTQGAHARVLLILMISAAMSLFCNSPKVRAQQTIFNVPTTDALEKGKVYFELDVSVKPNDSDFVNRFSSFVPRVVVGAGGNVEVGMNVVGNVQPGPDATTLAPTIKWKPYQGEKNGVAIALGNNFFLPVRNRAYKAGNYVYVEMSKTFQGSTRLTAGGYDFTRSVVAPANRAGGQFGFEQPLNKKVTLAADWLTGKHNAGYFTPGVVFKVGRQVTGYAGYSIGNQSPSRGNHFFLLEVGYNVT
jgi:hypothetical protein